MGVCAARSTSFVNFTKHLRKEIDMEFNLSTNIQQSIPQAIVFNYEELKAELTEKIKPYESMAVTEDDLKGAAGDKANLNKLKKALNDKKIEVKKDYNAPLEAFDNQIKELIAIIDSGVNNIDGQLKAFEQKRIDEKLAAIEAFYKEEIGEYEELLPLERILPDKWKNKGAKMDSIQKEIHEHIFKFKNDIRIIKTMNLECEGQMINAYLQSLDMSAALEEKHQYEKRQATLKKISESENRLDEKPEAAQNEPTVSTVEVSSDEQLKTIDVRFYNTNSTFRRKMKELCGLYNIKYGSAPKGE